MKSTMSLSIRQVICYWLLWLLVALLSLVLSYVPSLPATGEVTLRQATPFTLRPEELVASLVRGGDMGDPLFPWRLEPSQHRRTWRLPPWVVRLWQLGTLFRRMLGWNMAQWVDCLTCHQICHFLGAMLILYPLLEELEVAEIVDQYCPTQGEIQHGTVVVVLALNRLTAPRPLYKIADWMAYSILPLKLGIPARKFNDDRLGRTLEAIAPQLHEIWLQIVSRALQRYDIDLSVIFYDLTAFVMTGHYQDSKLADFGFAHNTPMDKRKVKLAGNVTQDGSIPFDWQAMCGQVADTATVEANMERLSRVLRRHHWPVQAALVVGDRAMLNSRLAILYEQYAQRGLHYLAGLQARTAEHQELLASVSLQELRAHYLLGEEGHRYWGVKRPITFTYEDEQTGVKQQVTHTALMVLSEATYRSWRAQRIEQLRTLCKQLQEEVQNKLNQPYWRNPHTIRKRVQSRLDNSPVGEVMKVEVWGEVDAVQMRWWVDRAGLRKMCRLDGRYLLVTNDPILSPVEMLRTYKHKDRIEKRFRIAKQVLRVRPIYLHQDERIEAMLLVNMIALLVYSLAERRCQRSGLEMTGQQLLYEFAPLHMIATHCWDGSILYRCMPLTPRQEAILQQMGLARAALPQTRRWTVDRQWKSQLNLPSPSGRPLLQRAEHSA